VSQRLCCTGKGLLAADESEIDRKTLAKYNIANTEDNRRAYRECSSGQRDRDYISGVILFDEHSIRMPQMVRRFSGVERCRNHAGSSRSGHIEMPGSLMRSSRRDAKVLLPPQRIRADGCDVCKMASVITISAGGTPTDANLRQNAKISRRTRKPARKRGSYRSWSRKY